MTTGRDETVRSALLEAAFVVLGVVLAFAANEWRESRADQAAARQAMETILDELESNRSSISEALEYHRGLLEMLFAEHEEGWAPRGEQFSRGFIAPAQLSRTAWASASETGALAKMDFEVVNLLSSAYAQQERYEAQVLSVGAIIYGELFRGGTEAIAANYRNLASLIATFSYREQQLLASYDRILGELAEE